MYTMIIIIASTMVLIKISDHCHNNYTETNSAHAQYIVLDKEPSRGEVLKLELDGSGKF